MGWFDGFPFKSRDQMEKEKKGFEDKIFPLGLAQKESARGVLRQLVNPKLPDEEMLFAYISAKDKYLDEKEIALARSAALASFRTQRYIANEDKTIIVALIELEKELVSLEEYPTAEQVRLLSAQL